MTLLILLALPFIGSIGAALLPTHARNTAASWAAVVALAYPLYEQLHQIRAR